ncbi:hypothetical protein EPI10_010770 [Gossypium australe]|uniref:Uncharacterized protein n=1 Tax=Gossypium australe TaxID=47621 RepID=A0A5B6W7K4_9ROSI|nr:hypothetical protein EPI10_010770 [Gossypium australe]
MLGTTLHAFLMVLNGKSCSELHVGGFGSNVVRIFLREKVVVLTRWWCWKMNVEYVARLAKCQHIDNTSRSNCSLPHAGCVKLNVDGAIESNFAGASTVGVIRDMYWN